MGRRGPGKRGRASSSLGRKPPLQGRGVLALREGLCGFQEESEQGKQGGTAESNFTDPVLVDNTQGQGRFVLRPVPQRERVF